MARKRRVAIQGITASHHEVAARSFFGESIVAVPCLTFHDVCSSLTSGTADVAIMAIENSIAGSILPNYALLESNHFMIVGELYLPIHHHLLALPGVRLEEIRHIESHPMAIRQCAEYLHTLASVSINESDDTAMSARRIAEESLRDTAAVASARAADAFGLRIIARHIETHHRNFTRFLALTKETRPVRRSNKASLAFEVENHAGSLADVLATFKEHAINLSRIQSIPILGRPAEYSMHVDVEWKKRQHYDEALSAIRQQVLGLRILGEYRRAAMVFK